MTTKKVSYKNLLKQAISEFDTSKTVEVKGPMLDPILSWDGGGEVPVYKDAASILERYYFNEDQDDNININDLAETEYNEDGTESKTDAEKHGEGTGTTQAGTSNASNIRGMEKDQEKDIAKEMEDLFTEEEDKDEDKENDKEEEEMEEALIQFFSEQDDETEDDKVEDDKDEQLDIDKKVEENENSDADADADDSDITEDIENSVIEKLIDEMEDLDETETTYTGSGVKSGMEASKEKKASGAEDDATGAGTEQAGTGTAAGKVPDRKDQADKMVKAKNYSEADSAVPGGPSPKKAGEDEDYDEDDIAEAFEIFKEAIEDDEDTSLDDIQV